MPLESGILFLALVCIDGFRVYMKYDLRRGFSRTWMEGVRRMVLLSNFLGCGKLHGLLRLRPRVMIELWLLVQ